MKIGVSKTNIFLIILVLLIQFFIYGCKESDRNTIAMGLSASPINLDPRYVTDAISYRISRLIYMSLVDFNESFHVIPELATWEKLSPTHYLIKYLLHLVKTIEIFEYNIFDFMIKNSK